MLLETFVGVPKSNLVEDTAQEQEELSVEETNQASDHPESCPEILHGQPLTDRKSTFQAHLARVTAVEEVSAYNYTV